jgi:hypothetical protein
LIIGHQENDVCARRGNLGGAKDAVAGDDKRKGAKDYFQGESET